MQDGKYSGHVTMHGDPVPMTTPIIMQDDTEMKLETGDSRQGPLVAGGSAGQENHQ